MKAKRLVLQIYPDAELRRTSMYKFGVIVKYSIELGNIPILGTNNKTKSEQWIGTRILSENSPSEHQAWKDAWKECKREILHKLSR